MSQMAGKPPRLRGEPANPNKNYHTPDASRFNDAVELEAIPLLQ